MLQHIMKILCSSSFYLIHLTFDKRAEYIMVSVLLECVGLLTICNAWLLIHVGVPGGYYDISWTRHGRFSARGAWS